MLDLTDVELIKRGEVDCDWPSVVNKLKPNTDIQPVAIVFDFFLSEKKNFCLKGSEFEGHSEKTVKGIAKTKQKIFSLVLLRSIRVS